MAGEWRNHGSYMIVALREAVSRLETPAEIEAEFRYSMVRDRVLEHRLRERRRFIAELKSRSIHIDEIAGVWLTPDVKFDRAEPTRALNTVVPREARPASDVDVARGDVDVAAGPTSGAASSSAAAPVDAIAM